MSVIDHVKDSNSTEIQNYNEKEVSLLPQRPATHTRGNNF